MRQNCMSIKDKLATKYKSAVVYNVNCKNCPAQYVGQTARRLETRLKEHSGDIRRMKLESQFAMHVADTGNTFDLKHAKVMDTEANEMGRLFKEAWYADRFCINHHIDIPSSCEALRIQGQHRVFFQSHVQLSFKRIHVVVSVASRVH